MPASFFPQISSRSNARHLFGRANLSSFKIVAQLLSEQGFGHMALLQPGIQTVEA